MSEQYSNLANTTVSGGGYSTGSGVLNVASTAGLFPGSAPFHIAVADQNTRAVTVILKVTGINSSSQFAVTAEGSDANANSGDLVYLSLTAGALDQIKLDAVSAYTTPTNYGNYLGCGYRLDQILITSSGVSWSSSLNAWVVNIGSQIGFFQGTTPSAGGYIQFDFQQKFIIDEIVFNESNATAQGTWQWQGSNDGVTFSNIGGTFSISAATSTTITTVHGNTTAYRYYRFAYISGAVSSSPWIYGLQFRISMPQS